MTNLDLDMDEDAKKAEKRARSEAQRVESMRLKREMDKQRQDQMSQALRQVDVVAKKIVFADSDDDSDEQTTSKTAQQPDGQPAAKKTKLFDDSSDEEEELEVEELIDNRHKGKKGLQLMKMEARFGNDSRFRMDDKFVSSDSEEEADEPEEETELSEEKKKQRALLSKVLGKEVRQPTKPQSCPNKPPPRPFTRFDPDNAEHVQWMRDFGQANNKTQEIKARALPVQPQDEPKKMTKWERAAAELEAQKPVLPERYIEGTFFEMDSGFADELKTKLAEAKASEAKKGSEEGFSFLKMIGRDAPKPKEELKSKHAEEDIFRPDKKTRRMMGQRVSDDEDSVAESASESSDSEDDAKSTMADLKPSVLAQATVLAQKSGPFFITGEENEIRSVVANFRRTQSIEKTVSHWGVYRDSIQKMFHHLKRDEMKKLRNAEKIEMYNRHRLRMAMKDKKKGKGKKTWMKGGGDASAAPTNAKSTVINGVTVEVN